MKSLSTSAALCIGLACTNGAKASLVSEMDGQLIYDDVSNITWLADANLAASNTFGVSGINADGTMTWSTAQSWITAMNTTGYLGYSNWRLPTTMVPDLTCSYQAPGVSYGYNCTGSEMGELFINELGGIAGQNIMFVNNGNLSFFSNLQDSYYWSGTEYVLSNAAYVYDFSGSGQGAGGKEQYYFHAFAVLPGNAAPSTIPIPSAIWLFGSGLLGLIAFSKR